ncbi:MAG: hypothetical protein P8L36_04480 [SAR324 cluster bacterium]|nr:hypothetical protein [SAR324 cluster bacterium]
MNKVLYIILSLLLFSLTTISCSPDDTEKVNEPISKGGDSVNAVLDPVSDGINDGLDVANDGVGTITGGDGGSATGTNNQSQCTSVKTFHKKIFGKQAKQTNDCGYVVAYNEKLTKLNEVGETKWETKITLKQRKHSNLGKPSVIQTRDGGYLYSDNYGIAKVSSSGQIEWTNKQYGDFEDAIEHSNGYYYVVSDDLVAHKSLAKVYKFSSKGKTVWRKRFGGGCSWEKLRSILETSDGELIIVGGKSHGNNKYPCTFEFYDDAWIIKVDADKGGKIWEKTYGGRNFERFEDIVKNPKGGYYAIGTACNLRNPPWGGNLCASNMSALWMKIDDGGNSLGKKHYTMGPNQTGFSITNTSSGGTAWVGLNKKKVGSTTLYRAVFYKLTGTNVNYSKIVDLGSGNATSIELTKDGGFIIAAGKNVFKTDSDMKIPTLETVCYRSNKSLCP